MKAFIEQRKRKAVLTDDILKKFLTIPTPVDIEKAKGGNSELAKKRPACFNYGFGRVYVRTYRSGRSCWTIDFCDENGKRVQEALPRAQSREEAALALRKKVSEAFDRKYGIERRRQTIGFTTFSEIYLQDCSMTTKKSWKTDTSMLKVMRKFFKDTELRSITPLMIEKFRKSRLKAGNTKSTTNRYLALVKRMFNVAIQENYAEENPVHKVKLYSEKDNLRERILTEDEERKLMENCSDTLRPILIVALNTGMRRAEILNLTWSQVDVENRRIRIKKTKSGKVRFIPVNDTLFRELNTLRKKNGQSLYLFFNSETGKPYLDMKKGFKAACRRAEIQGLRFHDLRHTFATRLVEKGADIETVRDLLGHHSITVTQRYTHSNDDRKRAAVELLSCDVCVTHGRINQLCARSSAG